MATKRKKKINQNVIFVILSILIIMIIYFTITIIHFFKKPADTVLIKKGELIKYEEVVGYIIRSEEIIDNSSFDGVIKTEIQDATRVSKGSPIITYVSKSEEQILEKMAKLDEKIEKAIESQQTIFTSDVKSIDAEIENNIYSNLKENKNLYSIQEYKKYLNEKIQKKAKIVGELSPAGSELKTLISQRTAYETELNNSEKSLLSPAAGLVSYRVDNLEDVLTYESISVLTSKDLSNMKTTLNQMIPINNKKVKLVNNFECYIAVPMKSEEAYNVKLNDTVYLRFENTGDTLISATVEYISKEEECVLLVFKIKSNVEELTKYRKIGFDVIWWSSTGLKVNKDAIFYTEVPTLISGDISDKGDVSGENTKEQIQDITSTSGETTLILKINQSVKLPTIKVKKAYYTNDVFVKILKETDEFVIIDNYKDVELQEMGISQEIIEKRTTLKLYDEALIEKIQ